MHNLLKTAALFALLGTPLAAAGQYDARGSHAGGEGYADLAYTYGEIRLRRRIPTAVTTPTASASAARRWFIPTSSSPVRSAPSAPMA